MVIIDISYNSSGFYDQFGSAVLEINDSDIQGVSAALVASAEVTNWYDLSSDLTVQNNTMPFLDAFINIINSVGASRSAPDIPYAAGYVDFRMNDYIRLLNPITSNAYVLLVYDSGATNGPGSLLYDYDSGQTLLNAPPGGALSLSPATACNVANCTYLNSSGIWNTGSGVLGDVSSMPEEKRIAVFKLNRSTALYLQIANASSFKFHEMVIIDGATSLPGVKNVVIQLVNKHGASF